MKTYGLGMVAAIVMLGMPLAAEIKVDLSKE